MIKLSIVTVSFNTRDIIEKTIMSVVNQNYTDKEYIIIDGGSTDGAQEVIERYRDKLAYYVSEEDGGIYFGMNKGIDAATGDYVIFMNAGDVFADDRVLYDIASYIDSHLDSDVVYGNSEQIYEYGSFVVKPRQAYIKNKMSISHQATFIKTSLLRSHKFDTKYRYAADFEQLSYFYLNKAKFSYCDRLVAKVGMDDGATYRHYKESTNEMLAINHSRGIEDSIDERSLLIKKIIIRAFKRTIPSFIRIPFFRFLAKCYKPL